MIYRGTLRIHVRTSDGWADGERPIELPFLPHAGLRLGGVGEGEDSLSMEVLRVGWDHAASSFWAVLDCETGLEPDHSSALIAEFGPPWEWDVRPDYASSAASGSGSPKPSDDASQATAGAP